MTGRHLAAIGVALGLPLTVYAIASCYLRSGSPIAVASDYDGRALFTAPDRISGFKVAVGVASLNAEWEVNGILRLEVDSPENSRSNLIIGNKRGPAISGRYSAHNHGSPIIIGGSFRVPAEYLPSASSVPCVLAARLKGYIRFPAREAAGWSMAAADMDVPVQIHVVPEGDFKRMRENKIRNEAFPYVLIGVICGVSIAIEIVKPGTMERSLNRTKR